MKQIAQHEEYMQEALRLAEYAESIGEVPVGAVVVLDGNIIGKGWNAVITQNDPTAHAEIVALRAAATAIGNYRLPGATLYVTLEPCFMCAGAMVHARISQCVFGAYDPKSGVVSSCFSVFDEPFLNHRVEVTGGVLDEPCSQLLKQFFLKRRSD